MTKGTIVLTPFPFSDLSTVKRRPAVIVSSSEKSGDDVVVAFISSRMDRSIKETDYILDIDHPDFKDTGLKRRSVFKMDKLVTVERRILIGEIGRVSHSILQELDKRLRMTFDLRVE
ncbi:MAG: type II toxin-antitoxin system PemK/MazF family toxin [Candidatus Latescibacteria bacterium]|nr:type II toxin-antitoxin system PemK/MazF family toxin [Candidatus Latescibacterota bacterium]